MSSFIRKTLLFAVYVLVVLYSGGCASIDSFVDSIFNPHRKDIRTAGYSVNSRPIEYSLHGCGCSSEKVLVIGAIHGDEPASAMLVRSLQEHLISNPVSCGGVIIVPVANPDGLAAGTRHNANGVDLNRNFPAENRINCEEFGFEPLTEPESRVVKQFIERYRPTRIISVHQPLECIDYDGPAKELAEAMAAVCDLPVEKLGAMPGSLGAYAGDTLGIAIVTVELPGSVETLGEEKLWEIYKDVLLSGISYQ
jgi:protein MpaA